MKKSKKMKQATPAAKNRRRNTRAKEKAGTQVILIKRNKLSHSGSTDMTQTIAVSNQTQKRRE